MQDTVYVTIAEVFDYNDDPSGRRYRFNLTGIAAALAQQPGLRPVPVQITPELYAHAASNGVNVETIAHEVDTDRRYYTRPVGPVLIVQWMDGSHILIDGNHRVVRHYLSDVRMVLAFILPPALWQAHCVPL